MSFPMALNAPSHHALDLRQRVNPQTTDEGIKKIPLFPSLCTSRAGCLKVPPREDFCSHVCRGFVFFLPVFTVTHAESESMATSCSMRHGSVCCRVADHHQSNGSVSVTVNVSLGMFNAPLKPQAQDVLRPRRTPEEAQAMAATKVRSFEAANWGTTMAKNWQLFRVVSVPDCKLRFLQCRTLADNSQFIESAKKRAEAARTSLQKALKFKRQWVECCSINGG